MKDTILARRYAKAFFDYAIKNNMSDKALHDLETVTEVLKENKELRNLLAEPFVSIQHKINILKRIFENNISTITIEFMTMMIQKKRDAYIQFIYEQYKEMYLSYKNIAIVTVTSAVKLDDATLKKIVRFVKDIVKGDIVIENKINKNIIGGFIVNYEDYQYDASVKTSINRLHKNFEQNLFVKGY